MTPMPEYPKVIVLLDPNGKVIETASNLMNLEVVTKTERTDFNEEAKGMPFNTARPVG